MTEVEVPWYMSGIQPGSMHNRSKSIPGLLEMYSTEIPINEIWLVFCHLYTERRHPATLNIFPGGKNPTTVVIQI